jgi:hypothetical protein
MHASRPPTKGTRIFSLQKGEERSGKEGRKEGERLRAIDLIDSKYQATKPSQLTI